MTGLERKAHRLVELARSGDDPTAAQLLSLHGAVAARIAAEGALAASGSMATAKAGRAGAYVKGLVAAAAIATGAAGYLRAAERSDSPAPRRRWSDAPAAPRARSRRRPRAAAGARVARSVEAPAQPVRAPSSTNSGLRLEQEAALLAEVQGALRSGNAGLPPDQARELRSPVPDRYAAGRSGCGASFAPARCRSRRKRGPRLRVWCSVTRARQRRRAYGAACK